ncbi:hypothetical protein K2X83_00945, partial [Patescibacteria group bacterium]|nr:hypothetical protein [Patescibacteria group bacterium]
MKNLSIQPVMGAYYLSLRAEDDEALKLKPESLNKLSSALRAITETFVKTGYVPSILFRIGRGDTPSAFSSKKSPIVQTL